MTCISRTRPNTRELNTSSRSIHCKTATPFKKRRASTQCWPERAPAPDSCRCVKKANMSASPLRRGEMPRQRKTHLPNLSREPARFIRVPEALFANAHVKEWERDSSSARFAASFATTDPKKVDSGSYMMRALSLFMACSLLSSSGLSR